MEKIVYYIVVDEAEIVIHDELFTERHMAERHIDLHGLDACRPKEVYANGAVR